MIERKIGEQDPLAILMSARAAAEFGGSVKTLLEGVPYRLLNLESQPDGDGTYPTDIAFLTREVTADSGKTVLAPTLERFYEILRASPRLKWLQAHAAGADRPIYSEVHRRGVAVTTGSGSAAIPVAQMAVTGLLALARRLPELMESQRRSAWEPLLGADSPRDVHTQTVLVVGLGPIGREVARLCKCLRMKVIGITRDVVPEENVDEVATFEKLAALLPRADFVVLACPLTDITRGLLNSERMKTLPRGARVINVSRGEVVVEADLIEAIKSGQVGGAFLDVFVREPLDSDSPLWSLPNVIISPHTAAHTTGHFAAVGEIFLDNLARWRAQRPLRNIAPL